MNYLEPRVKYNYGRVYNLSKWRKLILTRGNHKCQNCFNSIKDIFRGKIFPNEAHHIIARRDAGKNTLNNGIILCVFCHNYFDNMYGKHGLDYFEVISKKTTEQRIKEVRKLMKKRYIRYLLKIIYS